MKAKKYLPTEDKELRAYMLIKCGGKCAYCGVELSQKTLTVDHIDPVNGKLSAINGGHNVDNYNPCCRLCNCSKGTKTLERWRESISEKLEELNEGIVSHYRIAKRFGLIVETGNPVVFYFEKK